MSVDFTQADSPTCRCSCPSRQFPCKHTLGLRFEILAGKGFEIADIPQDIADKLAKNLGSCYLTGPQTAFTRTALTVRTVQKDPAQADAAYAEALRLLVALRSTIKKGRVFLEGNIGDEFVLEDAQGGRRGRETLWLSPNNYPAGG